MLLIQKQKDKSRGLTGLKDLHKVDIDVPKVEFGSPLHSFRNKSLERLDGEDSEEYEMRKKIE